MNELLLPLQGVITHHIKTQGVALGYKLLPFQGALAEYELYNRGLLLVFLGLLLIFLGPATYACFYWCWSRRRSLTVFTGLKVPSGTSTKTVDQSDIAPFQSPGSSRARSSLPFLDLEEMKPVVGST